MTEKKSFYQSLSKEDRLILGRKWRAARTKKQKQFPKGMYCYACDKPSKGFFLCAIHRKKLNQRRGLSGNIKHKKLTK